LHWYFFQEAVRMTHRKYTIDIEWAAKFILNMDIGKDAEPIIDRREPFGRSLPAIFSELEYEQTFLSDLD
jgi:hypothetical protein